MSDTQTKSTQTILDELIVERRKIATGLVQFNELQERYPAAFNTRVRALRGNVAKHTAVLTNEADLLASADVRLWQQALELTGYEYILPSSLVQRFYDCNNLAHVRPFVPAVVYETFNEWRQETDNLTKDKIQEIYNDLSKGILKEEGFNTTFVLKAGYYNNQHEHYDILNRLYDGIGIVMGWGVGMGKTYGLAANDELTNDGAWYQTFGNSVRVRLYQKGNLHIKVHPVVAEKLNLMLVSTAFLTPTDKLKTLRIQPTAKALPDVVKPYISNQQLSRYRAGLRGLTEQNGIYQLSKNTNGFDLDFYNFINHLGGSIEREQVKVLATGENRPQETAYFKTDPMESLDRVRLNKCFDGVSSGMFNHTLSPDMLQRLLTAADIYPQDEVLDLWAGYGQVASAIPDSSRVQVAERSISGHRSLRMHHNFSKVNWFDVDNLLEADRFDRIVYNAPTDPVLAHECLALAKRLLRLNGKMVATVLPSIPLCRSLNAAQSATILGSDGISYRIVTIEN